MVIRIRSELITLILGTSLHNGPETASEVVQYYTILADKENPRCHFEDYIGVVDHQNIFRSSFGVGPQGVVMVRIRLYAFKIKFGYKIMMSQFADIIGLLIFICKAHSIFSVNSL